MNNKSTGADPFETLKQSFHEQHGASETAKMKSRVEEQNDSDDYFASFPERDFSYCKHNDACINEPSHAYADHFHNTQVVDQQKRVAKRYRRAVLFHALSALNWKGIFRLIVILMLFTGLVVLWKMRYVLLTTITNASLSLLPSLFVLWLIIHLIRSIFRR